MSHLHHKYAINYAMLAELQEKIETAVTVIKQTKIKEALKNNKKLSRHLLDEKLIAKCFKEIDLNRITDVVINTAKILYEYKTELGDQFLATKRAVEILNLAILSGMFDMQRHHFQFYKHTTNLDKITDAKNDIFRQEKEMIESAKAAARFFNFN